MKNRTYSKQYDGIFKIPNLNGNEFIILNLLISMDESENIKNIFISDKSISDKIFNHLKKDTINKIIRKLHQKNIITTTQIFNEGHSGSDRNISINEDVYKILDGEDITIQPRIKLSKEDYESANDILTGKKEAITAPTVEDIQTPTEPIQVEPDASEASPEPTVVTTPSTEKYPIKNILKTVIDSDGAIEIMADNIRKKLSLNSNISFFDINDATLEEVGDAMITSKYMYTNIKGHELAPSEVLKLAEDIKQLPTPILEPIIEVQPEPVQPEPESKVIQMTISKEEQEYNQMAANNQDWFEKTIAMPNNA